MLLLFLSYYVDVNFFVHSHIINGVTVVHSHIHNQHHHDTGEGGHTTHEITLINNLTGQLLTTGEVLGTELETADILLQTLGIEREVPIAQAYLEGLTLRGPPEA